jgi:hypothetical protein
MVAIKLSSRMWMRLLIETLRTDEIAEFLGIESEFVTYCEVLN